MVYDKNGSSLSDAYDVQGDRLQQVYDKNGTPLFGTPITIMCYNAGSWYGYGNTVPNEYVNMYYRLNQKIFDKYQPDVLGMPEWYKYIGEYDMGDFMGEYFQSTYAVEKTGNDAGRMFASTHELTSASDNLFVNQDTKPERRYYLKAYINVNGKSICFISTHLSLMVPYDQNDELLDIVSNEDSFIVVGDMNINADDTSESNFQNSVQLWLNEGYHSAHGVRFGTNPTWYNTDYKGHSIDQIYTSADIQIYDAFTDDTKLNTVLPGGIDHCPLIARAIVT